MNSTIASKISGLEIKPLVSHGDDRGFFREIVRSSDDFFEEKGFAQWSHSKMQQNVVKAWHYHHLQIDWWYLGLGAIEAVFYDNRPESSSYKTKQVLLMGEPELGANAVCVKIPQGVLHGLKVISEFAHLFYITSQVYNPEDEGRFTYNSDLVAHDWGEGVIVADNDKRDFIPTNPRKK